MSDIIIKKCGRYDTAEIKEKIREGFERLGGLDKYIKTGEKVLLKPNALVPVKPETAVVTHPVFVRAVIQLAREKTDKIFIGESPGAGKYGYAASVTGVKKAAEEEGAEIIDFKADTDVVRKEKIIYNKFRLDKRLLEMDKIINLPKLKTHSLMQMTLCVKNMYGIIPGLKKLEYHANAERDKEIFAAALIDVYRACPPAFNIMDGITAMEGDGPGTGGTPVDLGVIIMGEDGFAIDAMVPGLVGADPDRVYTNAVYKKRAKSGAAPVYRVIEGEEKLIKKFKMPPDISRKGFFGFFIGFLKEHALARPAFDPEKCTACGICISHCPVNALTFGEKKQGYNEIKCDYKKCISCFCCHEMCGENAVRIKKRFLSFLFG